MYAIVEIAGQQFKVEKDRFVYAHHLVGTQEGDAVTFDKVLLVDNDGTVNVGVPTIEGATVTGKVLAHVKGEKVIIFKKKRRKGYVKKNGHRQQFTKVMIESINA
jgi:large subunit ribosomal protein L21